MNVIAVGAHPDDIEYGCAGTLMRHVKRGDRVTLIVLSRGEKGGDPGSRAKEARESGRMIGAAKVHVFDYPDTSIPQSHEVIERLEGIIRAEKPQRVYTHSVKDTHQDHRNAAYSTIVAARSVPEILAYETPSLFQNFIPNYFIDISRHIDDKIKALSLFATQNSRDYMKIKAIRGLSQFRGLATMAGHSEAFEVVRILKPDGV